MSFKVKCMTTKAPGHGGEDAPELQVGSDYTVVRELCGGAGYVLEEVDPGGHYAGYDYRFFSPLDGPCEKEILEARYETEAARLDEEFHQINHEAMERSWKVIEDRMNKIDKA